MPSSRSRTVSWRSPRITSSGWGRVEVDGFPEPFRDTMLFPGGAREWDWSASGTSHLAGIEARDVETLLALGAREIVLSTGRLGLLRVPRTVVDLLVVRGVTVQVLRTGPAIRRYNELATVPDGPRVGALIHSTC